MNNQAIPFIRYYGGKFEINADARDFLESLDDAPIAVISIVGKYRTGKSFFVNRVLLNRSVNDGFSVGPTINPCTKGLWLWTELLPTNNPDHPTMKALIIDTEGFGGMDENVNHDTRIFLFSLLLSSFFIYNSVGSIDENALQNISLIVNLAKEIQIKSQSQDQGDPSAYFPYFMWVVRDFALQMVDQNGTPMVSREYLEKALELQKGLSDAVEQKNRIRRLIKHFFRERDCITMVRPVEAEKELQKLDTMKNSELRMEFVEQMKQVQGKIFKKVKPKTLQGAFLTGPMLLQLAAAYVETMNSGKVPDVESAWGFVCRAEGEKAVYECQLEIERTMAGLKNAVMTTEELSQARSTIQDRVLKLFKQKAIGQDEDLKHFKEKINQQLDVQYKQLKQNNKSNLQEHYQKMTEQTVQYIEQKLRNEEYQSFFELQSEMFKFREQFEKEVGRSAVSSRFFLSLSVQIYQQAAERLSHKASQKSSIEIKRLEHKVASLEGEVHSRRTEWDQERAKLYDMVQKLEREKAQLLLSEQGLTDKLNRSLKDFERSEKQCDELRTSLRDKEIHLNQQYADQNGVLRQQLDKARSDLISQQSNADKECALLRQENQFLKRETQGAHDRVQMMEMESKKQRSEISGLTSQCEALQQRCSQIDQGRAQEIQKLQQEFEKKVQELTDDINRKKQQVRQQNEWLVEKNYLENQVSFLKNQLEENKRLHDALLIALQQGMSSQDSENNQELVETNRNLSAAMDKIEMRCKILEEKGEKLKKFKRMIKNCISLQCVHCQKSISQSIFNQHLSNCNGINQSDSVSQSVAMYHRQSSAMLNLTHVQAPTPTIANLDLSLLQISINQTMVRETSDNKPYTEYMIKVQYADKKWTVSRRYKNFCELHQALQANFPGLKLPDSQQAIISVQDINNIFQSKRPTVIEDRRKALQQYIRELAKIDIIRNSKCYKKFLDMEPDSQDTTNQSQSQLRSISQMNSPCNIDTIQQLQSSRDNMKDIKQWKQPTQPPIMGPPRNSVTGKEISLNVSRIPLKDSVNNQSQQSYRIDKKMLPQSPQSFLKSWNEKQNGEKQHRENTQRFTSEHMMNTFQ